MPNAGLTQTFEISGFGIASFFVIRASSFRFAILDRLSYMEAMKLKVTMFLDVISSWCFWAQPAWDGLEAAWASTPPEPRRPALRLPVPAVELERSGGAPPEPSGVAKAIQRDAISIQPAAPESRQEAFQPSHLDPPRCSQLTVQAARRMA